MRKTKEILRLHFVAGLPRRQIARSCSIARSTVSDYLGRVEAAGLTWAEIQAMSEAELNRRLFPEPASSRRSRPQPDWAYIHRELRRKHVTLQLLWQEYKETHPEGYQYSQFCDRYGRWRKKVDLVLRQTHRGGEKTFVDFAGDTVQIVDPQTGALSEAHIFVAVLAASNYTFAWATPREDLPHWIDGHVRAFDYFGGSTQVVIPDNPKSGVHHACFYEPELNPSYADRAEHYQVAVMPARPRKPRDKGKVEAAVLVVEHWILAALRRRTFFSLAELNQAIAELLEDLNHRPFKKLPGTRRELYEQIDRPALRPLPATRYQFARWKGARVNIDYDVELDYHYYSVPYALVGREVWLRYTEQFVEIFHEGERVACHRRSRARGQHTTLDEHRPACHRRYLQWSPSRLVNWAKSVGPETAAVVQHILESRLYPEQAYRSCLGVLRLGKTFGNERLEAACHRALRLGATSYRSVKSILQTGLDREPLPERPPTRPALDHRNIRGKDYFEGKEKHHVC